MILIYPAVVLTVEETGLTGLKQSVHHHQWGIFQSYVKYPEDNREIEPTKYVRKNRM